MNCTAAQVTVHAYLDGELQPAEVLEFEAHLLECFFCRQEYEALLATAETIRGARGIYDAPEESLASARRQIRRRWISHPQAYAAAAAIVFGLISFTALDSHADTISDMAAQSHLDYAAGKLPLDIHSEKANAVADWLSARLAFRLSLHASPQPQILGNHYVLEGARLLEPYPRSMAYVAYRVEGRPVSLLMTSSDSIVPSGGEISHSGRLKFHKKIVKGLRVITWADQGIKYALVSELASGDSESCMVCHANDRTAR